MPNTRSRALRIRPFRPDDRRAVRRICCETAFAGDAVEPLFPDRDAFADFFTRYYTDWEPETTFVAEVDGEVVGYLTGCTRHRRFRLVQPLILALFTAPKVLWRLLTGRYGPRGRRFLRWFLLRSWRETPAAPPGPAAHFHFNMLPGHRNTGAALRLWRAFDRLLVERGVERVYGQIQTGDDFRPDHLFQRWGFEVYDRRETTKFDGLRDETVYVTTFLREAGDDGSGAGAAAAGTRRARSGDREEAAP